MPWAVGLKHVDLVVSQPFRPIYPESILQLLYKKGQNIQKDP